jgi:UDP-glucose 4-epimerase
MRSVVSGLRRAQAQWERVGMNVMVTGGAGYIGSHAVQRLARDGHRVLVVDNLVRGNAGAIAAIQRAMPDAASRVQLAKVDLIDNAVIASLLREHRVEAVLHFAALAYVGESVEQPLRYYKSNAAASLSLLEACHAAGIGRFVFSSTCASYGEPSPEFIPIPETCPQRPINPYGRSKLHAEHMLFDHAAAMRAAGRPFAFAALRYFNVAGADRTGVIGEDHKPETHLVPIVLQAALGQRESVQIHGTDYPTPDGTCIRDYVHVEDLIDAHVTVLNVLKPGDTRTYNLGMGKGCSVREIIEAARRVTATGGRPIVVKEGPRRAGDPPTLFADPSKIRRELGWSCRITNLDEIIASAWKWMKAHPRGYES